ncbi:hypothetical protein M5689_002311 [Euphorbia peplus]|nr:hypothetical protein M5689_002311 [Euphorbia peplus]
MDRFLATLKRERKEVDDQHRALICKKGNLKSSLAKLEKDIEKSNNQNCETRQREKMNRFRDTLQNELKKVEDQLKVLICKKDKLESSLAKLGKDIQINEDQIYEIRRRQQQLKEKFEDLNTFTT